MGNLTTLFKYIEEDATFSPFQNAGHKKVTVELSYSTRESQFGTRVKAPDWEQGILVLPWVRS